MAAAPRTLPTTCPGDPRPDRPSPRDGCPSGPAPQYGSQPNSPSSQNRPPISLVPQYGTQPSSPSLHGTSPITNKSSSTFLEMQHVTQGSGNLANGQQTATAPVYSAAEKLGWQATGILIGGTIGILASVMFLTFVWFSSSNNKTWRRVAVANWFTRVVTISALILRAAASFQAALATSMLACLAMENAQVLLFDAISVSVMRSIWPAPYSFTWVMLKAFGKSPQRWRLWRKMVVPGLGVLLVTTTLLIQFSSTVLLSDLSTQMIVGNTNTTSRATNFRSSGGSRINPTMTSWSATSFAYPSFAEYREPPDIDQIGIKDTGMTLRAFLPYPDALSRTQLHTYSGKATVLDARVICMRPQFMDEALAVIGGDTIVFTGRVAPTFNNYSQVSNMGLENGTKFACIQPPFRGWPISLCQLDQSNNHWPGQLVSPFRPPSAARQYEKNGNPRFGTAYMAMNISDGSYPDLRKVFNAGENIAGRPEVPPVRPVSYSENGEWQDLVFSGDSTSVRISVTICYSSFDSADLIITARRKSVGLEPSRQYTPDTNFTYNAVRQQLGLANLPEDAKPSMEQRGILALGKRDSWLPGENESTTPSGRGSPDEPITYIADISSMSGPYAGPGGDNYTAILSNAPHRPIMQYGFSGGGNVTAFSPDMFTTGLFQEILRHNFCIASAVQSVITILAGIVYYS
ncbi:MAG: Mitochondrial outer membrane protein iml2 [Trichoglossum hirsutum]|nr:MAG: Mitochondrial outer membrane protein iml2 [Trichoglossum hirsutum]